MIHQSELGAESEGIKKKNKQTGVISYPLNVPPNYYYSLTIATSTQLDLLSLVAACIHL